MAIWRLVAVPGYGIGDVAGRTVIDRLASHYEYGRRLADVTWPGATRHPTYAIGPAWAVPRSAHFLAPHKAPDAHAARESVAPRFAPGVST